MAFDDASEAAARAAALARATVGAEPEAPADVHPVHRLDRDSTYYLVQLRGAAVAVDAASGEIMTWGETADPVLVLDGKQARDTAGLGEGAETRLVWKVSGPSRSPLYPFWEVRDAEKIAYVDQQRRVWRELPAAGPGG